MYNYKLGNTYISLCFIFSKRELKELKNKQARDAKEKLELEKRLKAEKEREEKAKLAMLAQEKHREEAERKKNIRLQQLQVIGNFLIKNS